MAEQKVTTYYDEAKKQEEGEKHHEERREQNRLIRDEMKKRQAATEKAIPFKERMARGIKSVAHEVKEGAISGGKKLASGAVKALDEATKKQPDFSQPPRSHGRRISGKSLKGIVRTSGDGEVFSGSGGNLPPFGSGGGFGSGSLKPAKFPSFAVGQMGGGLGKGKKSMSSGLGSSMGSMSIGFPEFGGKKKKKGGGLW